MAVVPRKTKKGVVYWVATRGSFERVGHDRREAERLDARRKKEVKAGTFAPAVTGAVKVGTWLRQWMATRTNRSAITERSLLRSHCLTCEWLCEMRMEDVRPPHAKRFIAELKAKVSPKTLKPLAPKYVANVNGVMKAAFNAALLDEVVSRDVWRLPPGTISKKSKVKVPYTRADAATLLGRAERQRRVWLALAFYTGMRCGEVCGRRWRDYDPAPLPLGALTVATQYQDLPLKTDNPRRVPVHPELAAVLREWWTVGFQEVYLRRPRADDFIVPSLQGGGEHALSRSAAYKAIASDCKVAEVPCRGQHAARHTFISAVQRGGADPKVVERITHNASGSMVDHYTHREWDELCAAILCLRPYGQKLDAALDREFLEGRKQVESSSDSRTRTQANRREPVESARTSGAHGVSGASKCAGYRVPGAELDASQELPLPALALALAYCRVSSRLRLQA